MRTTSLRGSNCGSPAPPISGGRKRNTTAATPPQYRNGKGGRGANLHRNQGAKKRRRRKISRGPSRGEEGPCLIGPNLLTAPPRRTATSPPGDLTENLQASLALTGQNAPATAQRQRGRLTVSPVCPALGKYRRGRVRVARIRTHVDLIGKKNIRAGEARGAFRKRKILVVAGARRNSPNLPPFSRCGHFGRRRAVEEKGAKE